MCSLFSRWRGVESCGFGAFGGGGSVVGVLCGCECAFGHCVCRIWYVLVNDKDAGGRESKV